MKLAQLQVAPNFVIIEMIEFKGDKTAPVLFDFNGNVTSSSEKMKDHPYMGMVVARCDYFFVGDTKMICPLKKGDVVLLPGFPIVSKGGVPQNAMIIEGKKYVVVRFSEIRGWFIPTEDQKKEFSFKLIEAAPSVKSYEGELK